MAKNDKRDEIVRAALELIAEHGFHGAPMAMIAERAGVGAGTIYRYFENKDVLIVELFGELEERSRLIIKEGYAPDKPIRERFIHLCAALMHYLIFVSSSSFSILPMAWSIAGTNFLGQKKGVLISRNSLKTGYTNK